MENVQEGGIQIFETDRENYSPTRLTKREWIGAIVGSSIIMIMIIFFFTFSSSNCDNPLLKKLQHDSSSNHYQSLIRETLNSSFISKYILEFSYKSHLAGSKEDEEFGAQIEEYFKEFKLQNIHRKSYKVLLSIQNPNLSNNVSIVDSNKRDIFTVPHKDAYAFYSPAGEVFGQPMFVNYGRPSDYIHLQEYLNLSENTFKDKILIAKQYHISANEQYRYASLMQASALLLFPDPEQFNPNNEKPYPASNWLPTDGVKSDSIYWNGAGDPETFE